MVFLATGDERCIASCLFPPYFACQKQLKFKGIGHGRGSDRRLVKTGWNDGTGSGVDGVDGVA